MSDEEEIALMDAFEKQGIDLEKVQIHTEAKLAEVLESNNLHLPVEEEI